MPFRSKAQQRYLYLYHPDIAERWSKVTDFKKLPERVGPPKAQTRQPPRPRQKQKTEK